MTRTSPYQGLVPYSEDDADWFFGREGWREIVVDNLRAYRVSILYGASGVGKSSVLGAGVVRHLREHGEEQALFVVPFSSWSADDPVAELRAAVGATEGSLADAIVDWGRRTDGLLLLVLDQFEEYFLYHGNESGPGSFAEELAEALRRRDTPADVLLSIREDSLALLDRFEGRVPGLLDNLIRIDHLDRAGARAAIERPLERWSELGNAPVAIEPALVDAVLDQVAAGRVTLGDEAGAADPKSDRIEAPYLQLVLSRLWVEETEAGSRVLRLETLERLGGAERIVRTHLDSTMDAFPRGEQDDAARIFRHLVTPSGTKIAHRAADLAELAEVPAARLEPVLQGLAGEARILRPVGDGAYEIYHDALAGPILDWRGRWQDRQRRRRERRRAVLLAAVAAFFALVAASLVFLTLRARHAQLVSQSRELAASASAQLGSDPQASVRLAVRAVGKAHTDQAEDALREAVAAANLRAVLRGNRYSVSDALFSPDGRLALLTGEDGSARLYSVPAGKPLAVMRVPTDSTGVASFSADGRFLVTGSGRHDRAARIWAVPSGRLRHVLRGHEGAISAVSFSRDGSLVLTASEDGTARVWSAESGKAVAILRGHQATVRAAVFSPDGKLAATASEDGTGRIWNIGLGRTVALLRGHADRVTDIAWSPDGSLVVTASDDQTARVWDPLTGRQIAVLRGHEGGLGSAVFSPDGSLVLTASDDDTARVWTARSGEPVAVMRGHGGRLSDASFSADGALVLTASDDGTARVWSATSGIQVAALVGHTSTVTAAAFDPHGAYVVTSSLDGTGRLWDISATRAAAVLRGHLGAVFTVDFGPDGARLLTASADGTARVWDVRTGRSLVRLRGDKEGVRAGELSPDGTLAAFAGQNGTGRVFDTRSGRQLVLVRQKTKDTAMLSAHFSADGRLVAFGGEDKLVHVVDARTGREVARLSPGDYVSDAVFSPDATRVAVAYGQLAAVFDLASARRVAVLRGHTNLLVGLQFSPDGTRVLTAAIDGTARIFDARTGRSLVEMKGHTDIVNSARFSPDGRYVVTSGGDQTARVWSATIGAAVAVLSGHKASVSSAEFDPSGKEVVTASQDGTARLWDARTGQTLAVFAGHTDVIDDAVFSRDGSLVATSSVDKTARVYRCSVCGSLDDLLQRARTQLTRG